MSVRGSVRIAVMRAGMRAALTVASVSGMPAVSGVSGVTHMSRMGVPRVNAVRPRIVAAVMHEPAHSHDAEPYTADGEAGEIEVDHPLNYARFTDARNASSRALPRRPKGSQM